MSEAPAGSKKSTSVRFSVKALRGAFRVLGAAAPRLAARLAGRLFGTPPRHRTSEAERRALSEAKPQTLKVGGDAVAMWSWGEGPAVLLVHGWGSRGARLHSFVQPLVAAGYRAVTFDAPGHGGSGGRVSSLPQFALAVAAVARAAGGVDAIVAHSMGCPSAALAMSRGLTVGRLVFLAPAANPGSYTERFAEALAIPPRVIEGMKRRFEKRFDLRWEELDLPRLSPSMKAPLLVFHDKEDQEVPWSNGDAIARSWPGAALVTTEGLGHTRIVHDPEVISTAVAFLTEALRAQGGKTAHTL
jgi:pimeloyl-ACP methyl ester carboxylesterase